ncbi:MAG TPA: glucose-1-phosphate adenylyltransferase [Deltaproteobacteria bacterium]|nr:glucose-1-phosphate adenylyltransferase [Deltaproteobacteria bacterium]
MSPAVDMRGITAIILGGGRGTRLLPLTLYRAKPAVGFGGKYRIIDIPLSNSINSGIKRIFVLTQFLSTSLHRHIMATYRFDQFTEGFVEILAAQQTQAGEDWFQGPADAVRATLDHTMYYACEQLLILPGDQLYRMNYTDVVRFHRETKADITICVHPVDRSEASRMGLMEVTPSSIVSRYIEKPQDWDIIDSFRVPEHLSAAYGSDLDGQILASTGIYVFNPRILSEILVGSSAADFGAGIFPLAIKNYRVAAYVHLDYWQDIGTINAFFNANIALGQLHPSFRLHASSWPLYTRERSLSPSRITSSEIKNTLISEGVYVSGSRIEDSVIGIRNVVRRGSELKQVVMLGTDFYEGEQSLTREEMQGGVAPPLGIGRDSFIERAIIDKNVRIGDSVIIRAKPDVKDYKGETYWVRDGVTIIPKGAIIPSGTEL